MKKVLGLLGVVAACGVCCAVPLLLPMLGGLAVGGAGLAMGWELVGLGAAVFALVVLALVQRRRRQNARLCASPSPKAESCGCQSSCPTQKGITA